MEELEDLIVSFKDGTVSVLFLKFFKVVNHSIGC